MLCLGFTGRRLLLAVLFWMAFFVDVNQSMGEDLYRWVDQDGVTHFSDQPPKDPISKDRGVKVLKNHGDVPKSSEAVEEKGAFVIPFQRAYGGMLVDVMLNDHLPAKMIVDTGASTVKVNVKLLKKLNQILPANLRKGKALTAAGVVDAHELSIDKIDLGGAVKRNVPASFSHEAYDTPYYDGLLGLSFLSDFKMTIDYEKHVIHLKR